MARPIGIPAWNKGLKMLLTTGKLNPRWSGGKTEYICFQCNVKFLRYKIHVDKRGKTKAWCSPQCYGKSRKGKATWLSKRAKKGLRMNTGRTLFTTEKTLGNKHWNWQGGKGTERHRAMNSKEYILWRTAVFIRDDYTCIWCGSIKNLQVDHIKPWAKYPELRYAIDNGRVLCLFCHETTNSYPKQFIRKVVD